MEFSFILSVIVQQGVFVQGSKNPKKKTWQNTKCQKGAKCVQIPQKLKKNLINTYKIFENECIKISIPGKQSKQPKQKKKINYEMFLNLIM